MSNLVIYSLAKKRKNKTSQYHLSDFDWENPLSEEPLRSHRVMAAFTHPHPPSTSCLPARSNNPRNCELYSLQHIWQKMGYDWSGISWGYRMKSPMMNLFDILTMEKASWCCAVFDIRDVSFWVCLYESLLLYVSGKLHAHLPLLL